MKILQNSEVGVKHKIAAAFPFSRNCVLEWKIHEKEFCQ